MAYVCILETYPWVTLIFRSLLRAKLSCKCIEVPPYSTWHMQLVSKGTVVPMYLMLGNYVLKFGKVLWCTFCMYIAGHHGNYQRSLPTPGSYLIIQHVPSS